MIQRRNTLLVSSITLLLLGVLLAAGITAAQEPLNDDPLLPAEPRTVEPFWSAPALSFAASNAADIVLVIDRSGSMDDDGWDSTIGDYQPIGDAKIAAKEFINLMNLPPDQIALVSFSDSAILNHELSRDALSVKSAIDALGAGGGTSIAAGINTAQSELESGRHLVDNAPGMIVLSDGLSDYNAAVTAANAAKQAGTRIFAIGLGSGVDPDLMQAIASSPDDYYFAPTSEDLQDIYAKIAGGVRPSPQGDLALSIPPWLYTTQDVIVTARVFNSGRVSKNFEVAMLLWPPDGFPAIQTQTEFVAWGSTAILEFNFGTRSSGTYRAEGELYAESTLLDEESGGLLILATEAQKKAIDAAEKLSSRALGELDQAENILIDVLSDSMKRLSLDPAKWTAKKIIEVVAEEAARHLNALWEVVEPAIDLAMLPVEEVLDETAEAKFKAKAASVAGSSVSPRRSEVELQKDGFVSAVQAEDFTWDKWRMGLLVLKNETLIRTTVEAKPFLAVNATPPFVHYCTLMSEYIEYKAMAAASFLLKVLLILLSAVIVVAFIAALVGLLAPAAAAAIIVIAFKAKTALNLANLLSNVALPIILVVMAQQMNVSVNDHVAPEISQRHDSALTEVLDQIQNASGVAFSDVALKVEAERYGASVSGALRNADSATATPLVETSIYRIDGVLVDISLHQPTLAPDQRKEFVDQLILPAGQYKAVLAIHTKDQLALQTEVVPFEVTTAQVRLDAILEDAQIDLGQPVRVHIVLTNEDPANATGDLALYLASTDEENFNTWSINLAPGETRVIDYEFVPQSLGGYTLRLGITDGTTRLDQVELGYTVGVAATLAINYKSEAVYQPQTDVTIPFTADNVGSQSASTTLSLVTLDQLNDATVVHEESIPLNVGASGSITFDALVLPQAEPGTYTVQLKFGDTVYDSFTFSVAAQETLYAVIHPDADVYGTGATVTLDVHILDSTYTYSDAAPLVDIWDPAGTTCSVSMTQVDTGQYRGSFTSTGDGSYVPYVQIAEPGYQTVNDSSSFVVNQHSLLLPTVEGQLTLGQTSLINITVSNENKAPIPDASVVLSGTNEVLSARTDENGNAILWASPKTDTPYELSIEKMGFARTVLDLPVSIELIQITTRTSDDWQPAITRTNDGKLWVVWHSWRSDNNIWYKTSDDNGVTWSADAQLTTDPSSDYDPAIMQASDGTIWVVWYSYRSGNADIWYKTSSDGGVTWSAATQLTTDSSSDYSPAIMLASDGAIWVVWYSYRSGNADLWYKTTSDGGATWSSAIQLTTAPEGDYRPAITQTSDGTIWVLWDSWRTDHPAIWYKTSTDGGASWSLDIEFTTDTNWDYAPVITQTSDGTIWVARMSWSWDLWNFDIWYRTSNDGGITWSADQQFTQFTGDDLYPGLAALPGDQVALAWQSDRTINYDIWFGIIGVHADVNPPPHLDSIQNYPWPNPDSNDTVTIRADVSDETGISSVILKWWVDGASQTDLTMYDDGAHDDYATDDGWYGIQIGPFPVGTIVEYQVGITDVDGNTILAPQYPVRFESLEPFVKTADILFVPDYGGNDTGWLRGYYEDALGVLGYYHDVWDTGERGEIDSATLNQYINGAVIWAVPYWGFVSGYDSTRNTLQGFLDNGGNLFITGQDIGLSIGSTSFYQDYLHASYVQDDPGLRQLEGVAGDPISDGLSFSIVGGDGADNQYYPDEIDPVAPAVTILTYSGGALARGELQMPKGMEEREPFVEPGPPVPEGQPMQRGKPERMRISAETQGIISSGSGAIRVDTGTYKVIYFAFGFEGINSQLDRRTVMSRVMNWLGMTPPADVVQVTTNAADDWLPSIARTIDGKLWVVWFSYRSGNWDLWYKTSTDNGITWSAATQLTSDPSSDYEPAITQASDGTLWVVWTSWRSGNGDIWYKTSTDGGTTWSAASQLTTDPGDDYLPAITHTSDGTLWVVWTSWRSGYADIYYKTSTDGGVTWSADTQLTTDPGSDYDPAIMQASDGTIWVVWYSYRSGNPDLWYKTSDDNGVTWSADTQLTYDGTNGLPAITQASGGTLWVVWTSYRSGYDDIYYKTSTDGGVTWSAPHQWTRFVGTDNYPAVTAMDDGSVAVAWVSDRAANLDIWFGIIGVHGDVNPPPHLDWVEHDPWPNPDSNDTTTIRAEVSDEMGVVDVILKWWVDSTSQPDLTMYDDGSHDDYVADDGVYGIQTGPFPVGTIVEYQVEITDVDGNTILAPQYPMRFESLAPFVRTADILFVPDYGGNSTNWFRPYYTNALDDLGYGYDVWDTGLRGQVYGDILNLYTDGVVIWAVPYWGYFDDSDVRPDIEAYLDAGGKLFITGQDVAYYTEGTSFLSNYLHASYVQDDPGLRSLTGVVGDPIGDGLTIGISGGDGADNQRYPDEIDPISPAVTVFTYDTTVMTALAEPVKPKVARPEREGSERGTIPIPVPWRESQERPRKPVEAESAADLQDIVSSGTGGLRVDTGTYRVVFLSFGFEGINSASDRVTVMHRVLDWLGVGLQPVISDVRTTNVRDISFTVSWLTDVQASGEVHYGTDPANLNRIAYDDRGASTSDDTHYVTLQGLLPNTTYYFDVVSGPTTDDNDGDHYSVTTGPTLGLPPSDTIYSQIFKEDKVTPASGCIVYITLRDADGSGSSGEAATLSSLTGDSGYWYANLGNVRIADLSDYFGYSSSGDQLELKVQCGSDGTGRATVDTGADTPAPIIYLSHTVFREIPLHIGWNHISLPLDPVTPYTAEGVCDEIISQGGDVAEIDRWYASGWDGHICGLPFNDFDIELGSDYFIKSNAVSTWTIEGYPVTTPVPLDLQIGWNSIGIPNTDAYTAQSLCDEINDQCGNGVAVEVDRWYASGWDGHICSLPFNDFDIEIGKGYFVKASGNCAVTPSLAAAPLAARPLTMPKLSEAPWMARKAKAAIARVKATNVRDTSFAASWSTDVMATGWVNYGTSPALGQTAYDDRGANIVGRSHHVTIHGLSPQTTYYFEVVSGATVEDNTDSCYQVTTGPTLELPASDSIYGRVFESDGITPAEGAIVYITLRNADGVGSSGEAGVMSAPVDAGGWWQANLGNARLADRSGYFTYSAAGDEVRIIVLGASSGTESLRLDAGDARPAAPVILAERPVGDGEYLPLVLKESER